MYCELQNERGQAYCNRGRFKVKVVGEMTRWRGSSVLSVCTVSERPWVRTPVKPQVFQQPGIYGYWHMQNCKLTKLMSPTCPSVGCLVEKV